MKSPDQTILLKRDLPILFALFILALILRMIRLFDLDVWLDEVVLLRILEKSYSEICYFCQTDNFPPLLPWMLKFWNTFFPGELSLRFFSALLGSLTPPAAYLLGKVIKDWKFGVLLGIACTISAPLLYYSQLIRMYTLFPFFACLSFIGLVMGIRTNKWRYWILMAVANLFGFYLFVYMLIMMMTEAFVILLASKGHRQIIWNSIVAHVPTAILIAVWLIPLFHRYLSLQNSFWLEALNYTHIGEVWFSLGSGTDFFDRYILASIINLPFLFGIVLGIKKFWKNDAIRAAYLILFGVMLTVLIASLRGQNIFFKRYFMFLIPLYLSIVFWSWMSLKSDLWKRIGMGLTWVSLLISLGYYYFDYYEFHQQFFFPLSETKVRPPDGHAISHTVAYIDDNASKGDIIIHYSNPERRSFTYFSSIFYKDNSIPEYMFSVKPIPNYFGGQYMTDAESISSLNDLNFKPAGIWIVSLDSLEAVFDPKYLDESIPTWRWIREENLPAEIYARNYTPIDTAGFGAVNIMYFKAEQADTTANE